VTNIIVTECHGTVLVMTLHYSSYISPEKAVLTLLPSFQDEKNCKEYSVFPMYHFYPYIFS